MPMTMASLVSASRARWVTRPPMTLFGLVVFVVVSVVTVVMTILGEEDGVKG